MSERQSKVYHTYTPYIEVPLYSRKGNFKKNVMAERATIALQRDGNFIRYGISICCKGDKWDREEGIRIAQERMEQNFRVIMVKSTVIGKREEEGSRMSEEEENTYMLRILHALQKSVFFKMNKYKQIIGEWSKFHTVEVSKSAEKVKRKVKKEDVLSALLDVKDLAHTELYRPIKKAMDNVRKNARKEADKVIRKLAKVIPIGEGKEKKLAKASDPEKKAGALGKAVKKRTDPNARGNRKK